MSAPHFNPSAAPLRVAVAGPAGRLGSAIVAMAASRRDLTLAGGLMRPGSPMTGLDLGHFTGGKDVGVATADTLDAVVAGADVLIDVSTASAAAEHARALAERGGPALVIGATGFTSEDDALIADAAKTLPIVKARNFSLGVSLLSALVEEAAARLGPEWDAEILEMHHRAKADAPSGTALMLGEAVAAGRDEALDEKAVTRRDGLTGSRTQGDIGFAVLRGGGVVGDHTVQFAAGDEVVALSHRALDRSIFAKGALAAARWITEAERKPGLYDMRDVLGFSAGLTPRTETA